MLGWKNQNKTEDKSDDATWKDKSKYTGKKNRSLKDTRSNNTNKTGHSKTMKENSTHQ